MIVRALVGALAMLLGIASVLLLLEGFSERHTPAGYILLVAGGGACSIIALTILAGLFLTRAPRDS